MSLASPAATMQFEFACATDTGRARNNNEDSIVVDEAVALAVLADGMGGYNAGEVASGMATSFIKAELGRWLGEDYRIADKPGDSPRPPDGEDNDATAR